eukprot:m.21353 g.21353  ORF g.21353 m.21353 type:complete len:485 (+) comp5679_c0_seq1:195-1649(+)
MGFTIKVLALAILLSAPQISAQCVDQTTAVTDAQYTAMYTALSAFFGPVNNNLPPPERGDNVGAAVRLAFHDAGEFDVNAADNFGVDGCVDLSRSDNNGLTEIIGQLETVRAPFCHFVSRADFWVLAAKVAVEIRANVNGYTVPFRFGRSDAASCQLPAGPGRLPSAQGGDEEITRVFVNQMQLTFRDAAALIGAHTLGRTQTANSGFNGPWNDESGVFSNEYYRELLRPWNKVQLDPDHTEWRRGNNQDRTIMLNADMELVFNVVDDLANIQTCGGRGLGDCTENTAVSQHARQFAGNNGVWLNQFSTSYKLMTEVGYANDALSCVFDGNGQPVGGVVAADCTNTPNPAPTDSPTTSPPSTEAPSQSPTTSAPTQSPTTSAPTQSPTTSAPTTPAPTTPAPIGGGGMGGMGGMNRPRRARQATTMTSRATTAPKDATVVGAIVLVATVALTVLAVTTRKHQHTHVDVAQETYVVIAESTTAYV